jgi:hypothetical protein
MAREVFAPWLAAVLAACGSSKPPAPPVEQPPNDGPTFRVDVAQPASCVRGAPCEASFKLTALGAFKVNVEYPFKFVADATAQAVVDGPGTFTPGDIKTGTHTIKLRAETAGTLNVSGTFKLSVCTDDVCKIETPKIAFAVPVTET